MSSPSRAADSTANLNGLSAFVAKILDQLSLSAWLPAGLLSATLAILLQFRAQGSADLHQAMTAIGKNWNVVLILAVPVLVLTTLTTQAFSFGAIRALEGYSMRRRPGSWLRPWLIRRQVRKWKTLREKSRRYARAAFDNSESRLSALPSDVVMALRAQAHQLAPLVPRDPEWRDKLKSLDWRSACDPWDLARFDDAREAAKEYPDRSRILPTRLGNVLRSTEDEVVKATGEDLATFALQRRSWLEHEAQLQHDQFRTRLDMYCTLVFVSGGLAVLTLVLTAGQSELVVPFLFIAAGFVVLEVVAYHAAVASARGYCTMLRLMKDAKQPAGAPN